MAREVNLFVSDLTVTGATPPVTQYGVGGDTGEIWD